jgi:transcriptional regulator with PAS, ATPase and Fis domain
VQPFIKINCAAIPNDLIEAELFGYEKGAFTGARPGGKPGKIELAHKGTLFLDEIGDLPIEMQPKLLRILEEKEFERLGGTTLIQSDFRLIVATNRNLEKRVAEGRFRKDLYYRLNVIPLHIPPLRQRREDIIPLARHLIKKSALDFGLKEKHIDPKTMSVLKQYDWPGNIRELSNVLERTMSSIEHDTIYVHDLPTYIFNQQKGVSPTDHFKLDSALEAAEKDRILCALESCNFNVVQTASALGIHRSTLYVKIKKHNIQLTRGS